MESVGVKRKAHKCEACSECFRYKSELERHEGTKRHKSMAAGMAASLAMAAQERATSGEDAGCDAESQGVAQSADDAHDDDE